MRMRDDGSIQSAATPTYQNAERTPDYGMYRCMVTKVVYVDDPNNVTTNSKSPRVLYDVVVLGGFGAGQIISNCRLSTTLGGNNNFHERTLRASSKNVSKTKLSDCDGDVVFVQFVQGHTGFPVITALDQGIAPTNSGATKSDGQVNRWSYNGVTVEVNNAGDVVITRAGGSYDSETGAFTPESSPKVTVRITEHKIELSTVDGAKLTVDGTTGEVSAQDNANGKLKIKDSKVGLGTVDNELVDLVKQIADALSTATYPGFGAPASNVATYGQISGKLAAIKGGV